MAKIRNFIKMIQHLEISGDNYHITTLEFPMSPLLVKNFGKEIDPKGLTRIWSFWEFQAMISHMTFGTPGIPTHSLFIGTSRCPSTNEDLGIPHVKEFLNYPNRNSLNSNKETGRKG